jgi:antitoxin component YwqK of YwqJK toxin-antitoxin module
MVSLLDLCDDVLDYIMMTDPSGYYSLSVSCSRLSYLFSLLAEDKKKQLSTRREKINGHVKEVYYTLPNGQKHGLYEKYEKYEKKTPSSFMLLSSWTQRWFFESYYTKTGLPRLLQCYYKSGKLHGEYIEYLPDLGATIYHYRNGQRHGEYKTVDLFGRPLEKGIYCCGFLRKQIINKGYCRKEITYVCGVKHGPYSEEHIDTGVHIIGEYRHGQKQGLWKDKYIY